MLTWLRSSRMPSSCNVLIISVSVKDLVHCLGSLNLYGRDIRGLLPGVKSEFFRRFVLFRFWLRRQLRAWRSPERSCPQAAACARTSWWAAIVPIAHVEAMVVPVSIFYGFVCSPQHKPSHYPIRPNLNNLQQICRRT